MTRKRVFTETESRLLDEVEALQERNRVLNARLLMYEKRHPGQACPHVHALAEAKKIIAALKKKP